jgi:hypothetical protein
MAFFQNLEFAQERRIMSRIQICASSYGTPGEVVAVEDAMIVWAGPIEAIAEAESFDALFCHDDDVNRLKGLAHAAGFDVVVAS